MARHMTVGNDDFLRFVAQSSTASWPEPLWHALLNVFRPLGFAPISYHHIPPLGAPDTGRVRVVAEGYPETWLHRYIRKKRFLDDPIVLHALRAETPFLWSEISRLRDLTETEATLLADMASAGIGDGLAIPAFGPGGRNGYFGLGLETGAGMPDRDDLATIGAICERAHLLYCRMIRKQLPAPPQLTWREREILGWIARGKSNSVIAEIMDLSPHTVDAHIRRVFLKLGISDRVSAAVRGIEEGLIIGR